MYPYLLPTAFVDALFVTVTSGANMNFDRLRFVSERAVPDGM